MPQNLSTGQQQISSPTIWFYQAFYEWSNEEWLYSHIVWTCWVKTHLSAAYQKIKGCTGTYPATLLSAHIYCRCGCQSAFTSVGTREKIWINPKKKKKESKTLDFLPPKNKAELPKLFFPKYWGAHSLSSALPAVSFLLLNPECGACGHPVTGHTGELSQLIWAQVQNKLLLFLMYSPF